MWAGVAPYVLSPAVDLHANFRCSMSVPPQKGSWLNHRQGPSGGVGVHNIHSGGGGFSLGTVSCGENIRHTSNFGVGPSDTGNFDPPALGGCMP